MSEKATNNTIRLLTEFLPAVACAEPEDPEAIITTFVDYRRYVDKLNDTDLFDVDAIRAIARCNAENLGLDHESADRVFDVRMELSGKQPAKIWEGSGASIAADEMGQIVHYIHRPGRVEKKYGSSTPYILGKLGSSVLCRALGIGVPDTDPGYSATAEILVNSKLMSPGVSLHIGASYVEDSGHGHAGKLIHGSASGTLVRPEVDAWANRQPGYAARAKADAKAGLINWPYDRRAGLYDVMFAKQVAALLTCGVENLQKHKFQMPDLGDYGGVDIN